MALKKITRNAKSSKVAKKKVQQKAAKKIKKLEKRALSADPAFEYAPEEINWYPGHMQKALKQIQEKINSVDIVLEIRDARLPLSSANLLIGESLRQSNRLILFNKANLADPRITSLWEKWLKGQGVPYLFLNCFDKGSMKKVMVMARQIVNDRKKKCNPEAVKFSSQIKLMIIGIPNTGKSTIINMLAGKASTKTGDRPGHTRAPQWINVDDKIYLLDTPGIIPPDLKNEETRLWLCAIHAVPDHLLGEEPTALFLLKYFLQIKSKQFLERYKLESFDLSIEDILKKISILRGSLMQKGLPDLDRVYKLILLDFRSGELGKCCFENPPMEGESGSLPRIPLELA